MTHLNIMSLNLFTNKCTLAHLSTYHCAKSETKVQLCTIYKRCYNLANMMGPRQNQMATPCLQTKSKLRPRLELKQNQQSGLGGLEVPTRCQKVRLLDKH